ncbi:nuclear protein [Coprinopsis cinerea okayama7|uniref:Nuclear protein n=1 Tax=Coprinopsis cinerea (strain Okayama-7 / 130 / ATCC MYA-4618 / FGSC 9003) TaxID=240176 RepID=A8P3L3_COPC7|nr:nuclear protein [Coprinopsis cinerea okayama7\|eukprot:XP_001838569.2 nuclear protein [Coprinopsis cinerea okayama7\
MKASSPTSRASRNEEYSGHAIFVDERRVFGLEHNRMLMRLGDGVQMPGNRCSNCIAYNFECTYVEAAKGKVVLKTSQNVAELRDIYSYVESLENRLEKLENLLRRLCPDDNLLRELDASLDKGTLPLEAESSSVFTSQPSSPPRTADPKEIATSMIRNMDAEDIDEDNAHLILADNLRTLSIDPVDYRFFGKSSGAMLIQTAIELKNEYAGTDHSDLRKANQVLGNKREEFWVQQPWESRTSLPTRANYTFPEPDLMANLISLYFKRVNLYMPLLHRPSFERSVAEGLHLTNDSFAGTVLLVCAIASRFSDDTRVLLDGEESFHSAGWKWFEQVQVLSVQFLQGSSAPQSCWTMVGIGIRLAQDVGAHRKKAQKAGPTAEDELWKRAFWVLVCMDRLVSAALGRPCAIQDEDFDLEMPIECDDEYWETECDDVEQRWKQPPGKPSLLTYFCLFLKLNQILAFSLRTIYSINKSKILLGFIGPQWEQHIVAELDSTLNKWVDSIPSHLMSLIWSNKGKYPLHLKFSIWGGKRSGLSTDPNKEMVDVHKCMRMLRACEKQWHSAGRLWDILYELASVGDLPLPQPSPPSNKRERDSETPISSPNSSSSVTLTTTQPNGARPIAGSRRVQKETLAGRHPITNPAILPPPPSGAGMLQGDVHHINSPQVARQIHLQASSESLRSSSSLSHHPSSTAIPSPHLPAQQQQQHHPAPPDQTQQGGQSQFFSSLPLYSQDLGKLPLHGHLEFSSMEQPSYWYSSLQAPEPVPSTTGLPTSLKKNGGNAPPSNLMPRASISQHQQQPQMQQPSSEDLTGYATTTALSRNSSHPQLSSFASGGSSGMGMMAYPSGVGPKGSVTPSPASSASTFSGMQGISTGGAPAYGRQDTASVASGSSANSAGDMMEQQRRSSQMHVDYGVHQPVASSSAFQYQTNPGHNQAGFMDNDTMAMWSNAPTGFELDEWGTYLMNVSEMTHGGANAFEQPQQQQQHQHQQHQQQHRGGIPPPFPQNGRL